MPPSKKGSSQTAKKRTNDPAIMSCPLIKDHLMHIDQHLGLMLKARNLSPKERKDALGLQTIVRQAEDHIKVCKFYAVSADYLPERR
jgi:hypothetical protein